MLDPQDAFKTIETKIQIYHHKSCSLKPRALTRCTIIMNWRLIGREIDILHRAAGNSASTIPVTV